MYELQQDSFMQILQVSNKVDDLRNLISSLNIPMKNTKPMMMPGPELLMSSSVEIDISPTISRISHEQSLVQLTKFKAVMITLENDPVAADPIPISGSPKNLTLIEDALEIFSDVSTSDQPGR